MRTACVLVVVQISAKVVMHLWRDNHVVWGGDLAICTATHNMRKLATLIHTCDSRSACQCAAGSTTVRVVRYICVYMHKEMLL